MLNWEYVYKLLSVDLKKLMLEDFLAEDISIFLCGGSNKHQSKFRYSLGRRLEKTKSKYVYSIYYPETIFSEILLSHSDSDLLSLENFLAENVNAVVIPLQSAGTFTELGAFCNHEILRNKLIILVDPKYKRDKSFINSGPLSLIKKHTSSHIIFSQLEDDSSLDLSQKIARAAREIKKTAPIVPTIENPLIARFFYMAIIYIFDPINMDFFQAILEQLLSENKIKNKITAETIVSSVLKHGSIKLIENKKLSFFEDTFQNYLKKSGFNLKQVNEIKYRLSDIRIDAINYYYRKKGIKIGGRRFAP